MEDVEAGGDDEQGAERGPGARGLAEDEGTQERGPDDAQLAEGGDVEGLG